MGGNRARGSREQTQNQTQHKQRPQVLFTLSQSHTDLYIPVFFFKSNLAIFFVEFYFFPKQ